MASLKKLLVGTVGKLIFRELTIERVTELSPHLRRFDLVSDQLQKASCNPGDKIQLLLDGDTRTFTPFAFDAARGALSLVAYLHDTGGPGATWARRASVGTKVLGFGPRKALSIPADPLVVFGDETSLALMADLASRRATRFVLEVGDEDEVRGVLPQLGIAGASTIARRRGDEHLTDVASALFAALDESRVRAFVLSGRSRAIQELRSRMRQRGSAPEQAVKAHWAAGKRGLD